MSKKDEPTAEIVIAGSEVEVVEGELVEEDENQDRARLRQLLTDRREASMQAGHINNSNLYAGSPMYYYCKYCGALTDTLPENWWVSLPKKICDDCQTLIELGWHDGATPSFPYNN